MRLSLIITTYNSPKTLILVLDSVQKQTILPDEIIIADDGSGYETQEAVNKFKQETKLRIIYSWQSDEGFRAARSRNKAIIKATGDYIILIDGDSMLHSEFINDHISNAQKGYFVQGSRVLLSKSKTEEFFKYKQMKFHIFSSGIRNRMNLIHSNILSILFNIRSNSLKGIRTCNMGFYRIDCLNVNGFDNDFEGWGREDSEFIVRLFNYGIKRKNIRFNGIQFHLWHKENTNIELNKNDLILEKSIKDKMKWCINGINSLNQNEN
jgi:glycosyltransferase involved in cell wall biosynthesis